MFLLVDRQIKKIWTVSNERLKQSYPNNLMRTINFYCKFVWKLTLLCRQKFRTNSKKVKSCSQSMRPLSFGFPHFLQQMISSNLRWLRLKIQIKCPLAWSWWTSSSRRTRRRRTCSRRRWTRWSCPWRITPRSQSSWWLSPTQEPSQVSFLIMELVVAMPQSDLGGPGSV